jgi:hypothetical protein
MEKLRENPATACMGLPWHDDEDEDLLKEAAAKVPISAIAGAHKRTEGSIMARLKGHAWRLQQEGMPFIQICSRLNLDMELLEKHFEKMEAKVVTQVKKEGKSEELLLLTEIRDLLKELTEKIK